MSKIYVDEILSKDTSSTSKIDLTNNAVTITGLAATQVDLSNGIDNPSTLTKNLIVDAGKSALVVGPVTIPNITANGHLNIVQSLNVTGDMDISSTGSLNIIG